MCVFPEPVYGRCKTQTLTAVLIVEKTLEVARYAKIWLRSEWTNHYLTISENRSVISIQCLRDDFLAEICIHLFLRRVGEVAVIESKFATIICFFAIQQFHRFV